MTSDKRLVNCNKCLFHQDVFLSQPLVIVHRLLTEAARRSYWSGSDDCVMQNGSEGHCVWVKIKFVLGPVTRNTSTKLLRTGDKDFQKQSEL